MRWLDSPRCGGPRRTRPWRGLLLALATVAGCVDDPVAEPAADTDAPAGLPSGTVARAALVLGAIEDARARLVPGLPEPTAGDLDAALEAIAAAVTAGDAAALRSAVSRAGTILERGAATQEDEVHLATTALAVRQAERLLAPETMPAPGNAPPGAVPIR